jgi:hypothetical protein
LNTDPEAGRHVQYGFQISGPNVWITDAGPFGMVRVASADVSPFAIWISGFDFSGTSDPNLSAAGDPDKDGRNNLIEFALDGDPANAASPDKQHAQMRDMAGTSVFVLTLPMRDGAIFDGYPAKSASLEGVAYRVEGAGNLSAFDREVIEIPADSAGLPGLNDGWSYRSFKIAGTAAGPSGFLRLRVAQAP